MERIIANMKREKPGALKDDLHVLWQLGQVQENVCRSLPSCATTESRPWARWERVNKSSFDSRINSSSYRHHGLTEYVAPQLSGHESRHPKTVAFKDVVEDYQAHRRRKSRYVYAR
jgi:hypothetical protein